MNKNWSAPLCSLTFVALIVLPTAILAQTAGRPPASPLYSQDQNVLWAEIQTIKQRSDAEGDFVVSLIAKLNVANAELAALKEKVIELTPKPAPTPSATPSPLTSPPPAN